MSIIDERGKQVITERELHGANAGDTLRVDENAILTPLAADAINERGIRLERVRRRSANRKRIALGADHGGFEMKEQIKSLLADLGHDYQDFGTHSTEPVCSEVSGSSRLASSHTLMVLSAPAEAMK